MKAHQISRQISAASSTPSSCCSLHAWSHRAAATRLSRNLPRRGLQTCAAPGYRPQHRPLPAAAPVIARRDCRRSIFTLFSKPPREIKPFDVEPGWEVVVKWRTAVLEDTRPPPRHHLVKAFRSFFKFKVHHQLEVNSSQATALRLLLQYLALNEADEAGPGLGLQELATARHALLRLPRDAGQEHVELARAIYKDVKRLRELEEEGEGEGEGEEEREEGNKKKKKNPAAQDLAIHIALLTQYGASMEASEALQRYVQQKPKNDEGIDRDMMLDISRGLAREGREEELCRHMAAAELAGCEYDRDFHEVMTVFYAKKGLACVSEEDVEEALLQTKSWFEKAISGDEKPTAAAYRGVLELGLKAGDREWLARELQRPLSRPQPPEPSVCDVVMQWEMRTRGGFRKVGPAMQVLSRKFEACEGASHVWPTAATTNALLEVATTTGDEELVKDVLAFSESKQILPDATTYVTLINWLLDSKQPLRALKTYREMRGSQEPADADIAATNRLIRGLCELDTPPLESIARLVVDLEQRYSILDPETVSRLVLVYLRRDHPLDAIDALSISIGHFSSQQQKVVQDTVAGYFFSEPSVARAWDAYQILQQYFSGMDGGTRRRIMNHFFARRRPDMAVAALKHMGEHADAGSRPDADTYADFFEHLGLCAIDDDGAAIKAAHNLVRLDAGVQPSTRLYNALMMAYGSATTTHAFLDLWADLTRSAEGPSYASLEIVFWACARRFWGAQSAKKIWAKLTNMDVDITPAVYVRYVSAVGHGYGNAHEAMELLEQMAEVVGEGPDQWALGIVHNYLSGPEEQKLFAQWAKVKYSAVWRELEHVQQKLLAGNLRLFLVPDKLKA